MTTAAAPTSSRKLTLDDIADLRAYERERPEFRERIIELKRRRRIELGTFISVVFESRDTIRFQIQEMARIEKLISDDQIAEELRAYNPLVPERRQLCCSLFIELTSDDAMREWLPRLIGIEHSLVLRLADGGEVRAVPEEQHAAQLTRADVTSAVHYYRFEFADDQIAAFKDGSVTLAIDHAAYGEQIELSDSTRSELLNDLTT